MRRMPITLLGVFDLKRAFSGGASTRMENPVVSAVARDVELNETLAGEAILADESLELILPVTMLTKQVTATENSIVKIDGENWRVLKKTHGDFSIKLIVGRP